MANVLSIVSYKIFPAKFGGQKTIASFNEYFSRYHNLYCVTVEDNLPGYAPYRIFNIIKNRPLRYINPYYFLVIKNIIRQHDISHVIVEHPYYGWLGLLLKRFCKIKLIVHSHNIEAERFRATGRWWWKILWHYEKYIHTHADFTFCITENDRQYFLTRYKINAGKASVITYGIPWDEAPALSEGEDARRVLQEKYSLKNEAVYLFNGALDYKPNLDALKNIVEKINPMYQEAKIAYKIIICGKNLPTEMDSLKQFTDKNIIYAGFVDDISVYFKGADVFINPVNEGGGIKTKLVEALANNMNAVSTFNGAIGVDKKICNGKLLLCENTNWSAFAEKMKEAVEINTSINNDFFSFFYWDYIAKKAAGIIDTITHSR